MKYTKSELIKELTAMLKQVAADMSFTKTTDLSTLNQKPDKDTWSVLENLEHICRYGRFYIPEMQQQIEASNSTNSDVFKSGLLGNYFAKSMLPKEKLNKMKTFDNMNPNGSTLDRSVVDEYFVQIDSLQQILDNLGETNLTKVKTSISISNWIKLRLGDTLRVVIYHMERHRVQALNVKMAA